MPSAPTPRVASLIALVLWVASRAFASQLADASLLVYTEGKPIGFSIGYGGRWNWFYFGGELSTHNFSHTIDDPTFSLKGSAKLLNTSLLVKGFVPIATNLEFYGGVGAGYAATRIDYTLTGSLGSGSTSATSDDWGTLIMAGLQYKVAPTGAVKLGWRYLKVHDPNYAGQLSADSNAVELGLNFEF